MKYDVTIKTLSPISMLSGRADVVLDADVVTDDCGIPYIPGRRFRGVLYESGLEVVEMLEAAAVEGVISHADLTRVFGRDKADGVVTIGNLTIGDYERVRDEMSRLISSYKAVLSKEDVTECFTEIRYQTAIDNMGIAKESSLRNVRVVDMGCDFTGELVLEDSGDEETDRKNELVVALAVRNLRYMGAKRNRGFGRVTAVLEHDGNDVGSRVIAEAMKGVE